MLAASGFEPAAAETNQSPTILFLQVQLSPTNTPTLVSWKERPGELKRQPNLDIADGIHFELRTAEGRSLWHGVVADPIPPTVEHESSARSGRLTRREVPVPNQIEIMIRVPRRAEAHSVEFYTLTAGATNQPAPRKKLGTLPLPTK